MEMSRTEETMNKENPVRRQRSKSATEPSATKRAPLTPRKVPDFKAIHERNFQRMESIVDYKNRREAASSRILKPKAKGMFIILSHFIVLIQNIVFVQSK